jgi:hypothetical protein
VSDGVDLPRNGDRLSLRAKDGHDARKLVAAKVARTKCLNTASAWWGSRWHVTYTSLN